jgi:thiaminase (transcriptional activator TenA)
MSWSTSLRAEAEPIWGAILDHPFLRELGAGTLPIDRFRFFLTQDYPYLKEFCRVLGLAVSRGGRLDEITFFAGLLHGTLDSEMDLHRSYCGEFGIAPEDLEATRLAPAAHAYTRHLLAVGALGTQAEMALALLPCVASYAEIGRMLAAHPPEKAPLYVRWITMYASDGFQEVARRMMALVDGLESRVSTEERARCREHFLVSSRHELLFWEMAYRMETWPAEGGLG